MKLPGEINRGYLHQMFKMALVTSPIMAIFSITPVLIFMISYPGNEHILQFLDYHKLLLGTTVLSLIIFTQWIINIWIFYILDKRVKFTIKNWIKYFFSYSTIILIVFVMQYFGQAHREFKVPLARLYPFVGAIANNTFILIIYALITSKSKREQLEVEKAQLEVSNLLAQREQLKHKIHPHFLFNALNTLKLLIKKEPNNAEEYLIRLSNFLRFSITESTKDTTTIKEELIFCENYLELQKVRFKDAIFFEYDIPEHIIESHYLPLFTLQSLAENAIKHNVLTVNTPLKLKLSYDEENQSLAFQNNLLSKTPGDPTTGTGLLNLSQRFKLLSGNEIDIVQNTQKEIFRVTFKVLKK